MQEQIFEQFASIALGKPQKFKNLSIYPMNAQNGKSPVYLTLKEALQQKCLTVTEISDAGSVPQIRVINNADKPVLLVDGEELTGAKQNRILNTSILLKKRSTTIIPVSCTESGRWGYNSQEFRDSEVQSTPGLRKNKMATINYNLAKKKEFVSDQADVWDDVEKMSVQANVVSGTHAMKDIYTAWQEELNEFEDAFEVQPDQKGILVMINGTIAGFDLFSRTKPLKILFPKLLKSYAMDTILRKEKNQQHSGDTKAKEFLKQVTGTKVKRYKSPGHGWDYRFEGNKTVGSALIYRKQIIHAAFFKNSSKKDHGNMEGSRRRRDFRL